MIGGLHVVRHQEYSPGIGHTKTLFRICKDSAVVDGAEKHGLPAGDSKAHRVACDDAGQAIAADPVAMPPIPPT
jgi:hypothetical protein